MALVFDYINGFHDAANSIATIVSTKVLSPFQAVLWAALFNFVAFFIFRDHGVANTVAKTVIGQYITMDVIFSGLVAAIIWNLITWWYGIPSSSSHTLIGGLAGSAIAHAGFKAIEGQMITKTVSFIVLAPIIGMIMAFLISLWFIHSAQKRPWPKVVTILMFLTMVVLLAVNLNMHPVERFDSHIANVIFDGKNFKWILVAFIMTIMCAFTMFLSSLNTHQSTMWFKRLQLVSSAAFSIGHGGNDAQKVMGIIWITLWLHSTQNGGTTTFEQFEMPGWVPLACYTAIGLGTMSGGWKIVKTMGTRITKVTPFEGVAAETAGAITLFITETLKIPVSTTHTITGSIVGVGATKRLSAVRWGVTVNLLWAWILTIPISGIMGMVIYKIVTLL